MTITRDRIRKFFDGYAAVRAPASQPSPPLTQRFKQLLEGFVSARRGEISRTSHLASGIERFLNGFVGVRSELAGRVSAAAANFVEFVKGFEVFRDLSILKAKESAAKQRQQFQVLLESYSTVLAAWEKTQQSKADRFYILEVLDLMLDEECHSRMLAWLLDRNYRKLGTHAQGSLGFRLFLESLSLPTVLADEPYFVRREISGDESRIDIEVAARGRFLMHIEVKIKAPEGYKQTSREWDDLSKRAGELGVSERGPTGGIIALFVTPSGRQPTDPHFKAVSWRKVAEVLEHFGDQALAEDVRLFSRHYAHTLRTFILAAEHVETEDRNAGP